MSTVKTARQIIEETVQYYSEDPTRRGLSNNNDCMYKTLDGKMCAVGRCMLESELEKIVVSEKFNDWSVDEVFEALGLDDHDGLLKPEYRGQSLGFWSDLQILHDCKTYWEGTPGSDSIRTAKVHALIKQYSTI